jgi:oxygen-dependent protoporphyrinogen oxidase
MTSGASAMRRVAVIGGGIAGLSAAYQLHHAGTMGMPIRFTLFEASARLGGIIGTTRRDGFTIEGGPDGWVSEKPWVRELAAELGLADAIIGSFDDERVTYIATQGALTAMPKGMRMMVPGDLQAAMDSALFTDAAKQAMAAEPARAEELRGAALARATDRSDESVRDFTVRHFGAEVADTVAAPLLAGVFGGDISHLSVRSVMPHFITLEQEHGSLILGLQRTARGGGKQGSIFSSLRDGLGSLVDRLAARLPAHAVHCEAPVSGLERTHTGWKLHRHGAEAERFDGVIAALPAPHAARLLAPVDAGLPPLMPQTCSSAIVVALAFTPGTNLRVPPGFGFLVPQTAPSAGRRALLACTFLHQKYPHRAPAGGALLRAFFGGPGAASLLPETDEALERLAVDSLAEFLGPIPPRQFTVVRRWPDSLPLYPVGHLERIDQLEARVAQIPGLRITGSLLRGVGLPDVIHQSRDAAQSLAQELAGA